MSYDADKHRARLIELCMQRLEVNTIADIRKVCRDYTSEFLSDCGYDEARIIAGLVCRGNNKYMYEIIKDDYPVLKLNPNYSLERSVKETNSAVRENFISQRSFGNKTLLLSLVSVAFIGLTFWKECSNKTESKVQELSLKSDSLRIELRNIQSSLERIADSIHRQNDDTTRVRVLKN